MELEIHAETIPLRTSQDGVVYVGSTRVPLETVIEVFNEGQLLKKSPFNIRRSHWLMCIW